MTAAVALVLAFLAITSLALILLWSLAVTRLTAWSVDPPAHALAVMRGVALVIGALASVLTALVGVQRLL